MDDFTPERKPGFYVSAGLLSPEHMKRIGPALAEFLWLISHETREEGRVLNGRPITIKRIAADLGEGQRTARRNLNRLELEKYIERHRESGNPYEYQIVNSKKWIKDVRPEMAAGDDKNGRSCGQEWPESTDKSGRSYKEVDSSRQVDKIDRTTASQRGAIRPTLQDVILYCKERQNSVDPQQWIDYYTANGWKVGRNPMKDWKAAVRTWERNQVKGQSNANRAQQRQLDNREAGKKALEILRSRMANEPASRAG